jgi:hypothetical protein
MNCPVCRQVMYQHSIITSSWACTYCGTISYQNDNQDTTGIVDDPPANPPPG